MTRQVLIRLVCDLPGCDHISPEMTVARLPIGWVEEGPVQAQDLMDYGFMVYSGRANGKRTRHYCSPHHAAEARQLKRIGEKQ